MRRKLRGELYWKEKIVQNENLKLLQKEVHAANLKQRAKDLKKKLRKEKLMKKKKQKETHTKTEFGNKHVEKQESKEEIAEVAKTQVATTEFSSSDIKNVAVVSDEVVYMEIEDVNPRLLELSRYVQIVKHHEMSKTLAWGLTARKLLVEGARRRHVGALLANGVLGSIFGDQGKKGRLS